MSQRRGALTTFAWPPSLQVTGQAATAFTSVSLFLPSVILTGQESYLNNQMHQFCTKKTSESQLFVKERANLDIILHHFDGSRQVDLQSV